MTALLEQVVNQVRLLPEEEQDNVAQMLLQTLETLEQEKAQGHPKRKAGSAEGMIWMSPDFDEPLEDFKDYT